MTGRQNAFRLLAVPKIVQKERTGIVDQTIPILSEKKRGKKMKRKES
jgi:hypothetical protein